ncbi:pre-mRNA-splicing factor 38A [Strongylocentrotus purpuratus]|uniref:Pre-mRNA-splicing factor 38 n=1 Tax=Strongylocentrotus purpuratus TaxID=7668 RepID=A0A7M7T480_STRPU|nr:pre-mRNA-splicing factor 38A [Strongylocentrotus purpuratus]
MANRTVRDARSIKGKNPQYLVEKITRSRIYESRYWKEECFALSAELLVDKAMELRFIGGTYGGNIKPSPFLCLLLKMLQIQPEKDIVIEFIKNEDFKYVRCLGALYIRLVGEGLDVYKYLEPLYNDYRKIRRQDKIGGYFLSHVDEFIDELLNEERVCDIILPRVQKRHILEETEQLELRVSPLEEDLDDMEDSSDDDIDIPEIKKSPERHRGSYHDHDRPRRSPSPRHRRSRSRSPKRRSRSPKRRSPSPRRDRERRRSRSPRRERERRSRSRERRHRSPVRNYHRDERRDERRDDRRDERSDDRYHHRHRSTSPDDRHRRSYRK